MEERTMQAHLMAHGELFGRMVTEKSMLAPGRRYVIVDWLTRSKGLVNIKAKYHEVINKILDLAPVRYVFVTEDSITVWVFEWCHYTFDLHLKVQDILVMPRAPKPGLSTRPTRVVVILVD